MVEVIFMREYTVDGVTYARGDVASFPDADARYLLVSSIANYYDGDPVNSGPPRSPGGVSAVVDPEKSSVLVITL